MLSEGLVLAGVGLVLGLLLAQASISLLSATRPVELPRMDAVTLDGVGFAFSFLTALGAVCLFAIVPALRGTRGDLAGALQGRSAGTGNRGRTSFRNGLVVVEVALSLVLLIGAGLMVRSTLALTRVDPGFDPANVLTFVAAPPPTSFTSREDRVDFLRELQARISALPGVTGVSAAAAVPFTTSRGGMGRAGPEAAFSDESLNQQARYTYLFPDYFETMGVRLLEGRLFAPEEYLDSIPVVVVDALLAQALWPGESAVGKTLVARPGAGEPFPFEVIGVVEHQMAESLQEPGEDMFFYPVGFYTSWVNPSNVTWVVRAGVPPESLVPLIRREVEAVKADAPMTRIRTLESYLSESRAPTRFALTLTAFFAVSALVLAVVGLYGVLAYGVHQRTAEIGVRVAFGAEPGGILAMVLGRGMRLVLVGLAGGVVSALVLTPFMGSLLVGVPPTDLPTFLGVGALFSGVAALACLLPAWRATKVDPVKAIQRD